VRIISLSPQQSELFVAIGTDGIWDYMSPEDLVEQIKDRGMREVGAGSEHVSGKIRDLCTLKKSPLDDMTLIISHLKREG
jgi:serine/threonine protein phosphatase PrpC